MIASVATLPKNDPPCPTHTVKIIAIGKSRGIQLPQALLNCYGMVDQATIEERPEGLLLRGTRSGKASLKQTFSEMAQEQAAQAEDWNDLDPLATDGLDRLE